MSVDFSVSAQSSTPRGSSRQRTWVPRMWLGCDAPSLWRLMSHNRFDVDWSHALHATINSGLSVMHSFLGALQKVSHGRRIARANVEPPIFIVGHWRTGTTLLHELLILDPRHTYPTNYECFCPHHFLNSEDFAQRWLRWLLPPKRPMDEMAFGWERPQEDEFALCTMGIPSPYWTIAFPNRPPQWEEYFDLERVPAADRDRWKAAFLWFLKAVTVRHPGRIVLKSPPHTCRIPLLLEMFPEARFVHIVRDPYVVFPSTINLWKQLYRVQGLQNPTFDGLEEYVFQTFNRLYESLEQGRRLVRSDRFFEMRYEDLVQDPMDKLSQLYKYLDLGDFRSVVPRLENYLSGVSNYQTNSYREIPPNLREEISRRWGTVIHRYGYDRQPVSGAA